MKDIYTFLVEKGKLSESHKIELMKKRGFPEEIISQMRFFSGGHYLTQIEQEMLEKFKEQDLLASGVFIYQNGKSVINPVLLKEVNNVDGKISNNIVIPYLDSESCAYCVRPHKLGLKGVPADIYQRWNLRGEHQEVVLTEGEFKAAAGIAFGFSCVSIPGIASFSESNYPKLTEFLKGIKKVIIMFDNEVKDDPAIEKRYKPNPQDRYDTQFYAYYMATKLEQSGFEVKIATLPDAWREDGKIDIDGALKQGRSRGDLLKVLYDAVPRNEYLSDLPSEAKQVVLRKRAQKRNKGNIRREFNRYVVTRRRGKSEWDEPISNFVMRIVATHDTPDGIKREVEFINEFGRRSGSFTIPGEGMASPEKFRRFCYERGDFVWKGNLDDLQNIWESEFLMMDEGRYIVETDQVGWVDSEKCWVFGNVAISFDAKTNEQKQMRPDPNGVFWMEKRGIKPSPLMISSGKNTVAGGLPSLYLSSAINKDELLKKLSDTIGDEEAKVALGWAASVVFMEELFQTYGSFPFLFVTGRWQSGKSTVASWITRLFGIEQEGLSISQTTPVAIQRSLAYYSSMPVFLDEFRNTKDVTVKNGFLRNAYNRQSAGKGIKADFGLREARVRGTLIIAGEETPKDGALLTRCIPIFVSRAKRREDHYKWFSANRTKLSSFFYDRLMVKNEMAEEFAKNLAEWKDAFAKEGRDDRLAINYATVVAGYASVYGDKDLNFAGWLMKETETMQGEFREEQAVSVFLDDLMAMKTRKLIGADYWVVDDGKIFFYFHGLHNVWSQEFRKIRGEEAFKEGSIRAYLKEEPGFVASNEYKRIKGENKKCVVFNYELASEELRNLVEDFEKTREPIRKEF